MRIADVLREPDSGDLSGDISGDSSSRSLLSRWFRNRRKHEPAGSGGGRVIQSPAADRILTGRVDSGGRLPEFDFSSGVRPNEIAFNLGMGFGMAFVLAGNTNEMNKMVELRKQMEMLVKDFKGEVQRRDDSSLYTLSDVSEDAISTTISAQHQSSSLDMEEPKHFAESNRKNHQPVNNLRAMDQLEADLQVELERMQLNLEGEDAGQHKMELNRKMVDSSLGSSASAWYDHMPDENGEEQHGVCAHDLERRLHELLQTKQQERIEALECALEAAQRQLDEKENELCYWKSNVGVIPENEETYFSLSFLSSE